MVDPDHDHFPSKLEKAVLEHNFNAVKVKFTDENDLLTEDAIEEESNE